MNNTADKNNNILVAYFSHSGITRFAAEQIREATRADIFEIKPVKGYPGDYNACVAAAKGECGSGFTPELIEDLKGIGKYDTVFICSPNWWYTIAPPVLSFLKSHNLAGKIIIPLITHGGGGMANCEAAIKKACPEAVFGESGLFLDRTVKQSALALAKWALEAVAKGK